MEGTVCSVDNRVAPLPINAATVMSYAFCLQEFAGSDLHPSELHKLEPKRQSHGQSDDAGNSARAPVVYIQLLAPPSDYPLQIQAQWKLCQLLREWHVAV